jgi:photosystem II stability/assembly factor-like uncharacterized protein
MAHLLRRIILAALFSLACAGVLAASARAENPGLASKVVTSIAVDPSHPTTVYAATVFEGVFKSRSRGHTWKGINSGLPQPAEGGVLAVDPSDSRTLYYGDVGIFKSTDAGRTWTSLVDAILRDIPVPAVCNGECRLFVTLLAIHPASSVLYAATEDFGIIKSSDGGLNWSSVTPAAGFIPAALALDPRSPLIAYVTNPELNKSGSILKTIDGGLSWTPSDAGLPLDVVPAFATVGVHALVTDPQVPTTLYAGTERVVDERQPAIGGVFKSVDGGTSWSASSDGLPPNTRVSLLAIDPTDPDTLYALTASGLFESLDAGGTWALFDADLTDSNVTSLVLGSPLAKGRKATQIIYVGTGDGVRVLRR